MRESIDGASFAQAMIHAAASLNLQKQQINELNVFPVPDGDTGTNMSLTLGTAAAELRKKQPHTVGEAAATNASALLRGARGNSTSFCPCSSAALPRRSRTRTASTVAIWPSPWTSAWPPPTRR